MKKKLSYTEILKETAILTVAVAISGFCVIKVFKATPHKVHKLEIKHD